MALGAAVKGLVSLLVEMARDVDTSSPEAVSLPLTQRYRQVEDLLYGPRGLVAEYKNRAAMLNVGLEMIETITATRVSKTTGRLVPVYEPREWDDAGRPVRVFPDHHRQGTSTPGSKFVPARVVTGFTEEPTAYGPGSP